MLRPDPAVPIERPLTVEEVLDELRVPLTLVALRAKEDAELAQARGPSAQGWECDGPLQSTVATDEKQEGRGRAGSLSLSRDSNTKPGDGPTAALDEKRWRRDTASPRYGSLCASLDAAHSAAGYWAGDVAREAVAVGLAQPDRGLGRCPERT